MGVESFLIWNLIIVLLVTFFTLAFFSFFEDDVGERSLKDHVVLASLGTIIMGVMLFLCASLFFNKSVSTNELASLDTSNNLSGEMFLSFGTGSGELRDELVINYIEKTNDHFTIRSINSDLAKISYINEGETPYVEKTCRKPLGIIKSENCFRLTGITFYVPEGSVSNETDVNVNV